jgi:hypothetical protein
MITDLQLLYIGNIAQGERLGTIAAQRGTNVLCAESMIEALGMYITLFPNVTIIDAAHPDAESIYQHLRSVDAAPILVLVDESLPVLWTLRHDILRAHGVLTVSRHLSASVLFDTIADLANGLSLVSSGHRRVG